MKLLTYLILSILVSVCFAPTAIGQLTAGFTATPSSGCAPLVVAFNNTTTPATGTTYSWDLGNSTGLITLTNPGTSYLSAGTYTVTLTASNGTSTSTHTQIITVFPSPIVAFSANDTLICPGAIDTFTSNVIPGVAGTVTYLWSYGDGYTSSSAYNSHVYNFPSYFNITLNVTNSDGCLTSVNKPAYVHVRNPPVPSFTASDTHICNPPVSAVFTSTVTGASPFSYHWKFGDGSPFSALPAPAHTYTALGIYTVELIATDVHGCEDSNTIPGFMTVSKLLASFSGPDSVCINSTVNFTNTSSPYTSCLWLYGDGASDTTGTGHHTYHTPGLDTVKLVTYNGFCYDTFKHTLYIQHPVSSFTVTPSFPCPAPVTPSFVANVLPNSTVKWLFGDSTSGTGITTTHTYTVNTTDTIRMIATSDLGCKDTVKLDYIIYDIIFGINHPVNTPLSGCAPVTVYFFGDVETPLSYYPWGEPYPAIITYSWNFDDGSTGSTIYDPIHTFTAPGIYFVKFIFTTSNGCTDTATDSIPVGVKPSVTFTATPLHSCQDTNQIQFTATVLSGLVQYYDWKFGEGLYNTDLFDTSHIETHHFTIPGTFTDTLIGYNYGCPDTFIRHNYVTIDSPNADVYKHVYCFPANKVLFVDSSFGDNTRIWFFGDGTTDTTRYPIHIYPSADYYNVMFTDYNIASGCRDTSKFTVNLTKPVMAIAAPDSNICKDGYVILHSSVISGAANYYDWYADGASGDYNNFNFIDTFHTPGIYTIMLLVYDQNSCIDTTVRYNYIHVAKPVAHFSLTPASVCLPLMTTFTDASTDIPGININKYKWTFGDGYSIVTTTPTVNHYFSATGTYLTSEVITDVIGCKDSLLNIPVGVYHPTTSFAANITASCAYHNISFTSTSSAGVTYNWLFGDGATSTLANPVHAYTDSGHFTVRLVVTDIHGCKDTVTHNNYISISKPHASFTMSDSLAVCPPFTVSFTNTSSGGTFYKWNFGNGDSSLAINPTNIYTIPAYDTVKLVAIDAAGCKDTAYNQVKVFGYVGAFSYTPDSSCAPLKVFFNADLSNVSSLTSIIWDFSDGITSAPTLSDTISHTYLVPGGYIPKLIIANHICQDSSIGMDTIKVSGIRPGFKVTPAPVCLGNLLTLADTSASYWSHITNWSWAFNGSTSNLDTVTTMYNATGTYSVTLMVTDAWGCTGSDTQYVTVISIPPITSPDSVICVRNNLILSEPEPGGYWSSNNISVAIVDSASGKVKGLSAGNAAITYTLPDGCIAIKSITVSAYPDPGNISGKSGVCAGSTILVTDSVAGGIWYFTGILAGEDNLHYIVATGNCDTYATKVITIYPLPDPGKITGQSNICVGAVISLHDSITNGTWVSSNPPVAIIDTNGVVTGKALGTTIITYSSPTTPNGCTAITTFTINVINPDFTVNADISQVKCHSDSNGSIAITVVGGSPPIKYKWSTGSNSPAISGLDTGNYILIVSDSATQCMLTDTFQITQPDTLQITAEIKDDVCRAGVGSIVTSVSGGTKPYNYLWTDNSNGSNLDNVLTGNYKLSITDQKGCKKIMYFTVPDTCDEIVIYDGISPNRDGINDTWVILGLQLFPKNTVQVFDKWGDEVFSATNYKNDWGGKTNKGDLPDGTYYYLIKLNAQNPPGGKDSYTGSLLIKR